MHRQQFVSDIAAAIIHRVRAVLRRRRATRDGFDGTSEAHQSLTCACGAEYRVVGTGRHRVIWPAGENQDSALMSSECPACGRTLAV